MGIKGLTKLLDDHASRALKEKDIKSYAGRKVAIDASMCMYQLLVSVRAGADNFTNDAGSNTSHIIGMFYRCIRLLELGIKPVFVFDGKPPPMKGGELQKRKEIKAANEAELKKAEEAGDEAAIEKFAKRINTITPEMTESCKRLLRLMGIPVVEAPCEAEAQCAELNKAGLVYAMASEDMDSLTFGTPRLVRNFWAGASASAVKRGKQPREILLAPALEDLEMDMAQFIDMCILCGCDYVDSISGLGPVTAYKKITEHKTIDAVIDSIAGTKYKLPEPFPYAEARKLFVAPEITPAAEIDLKWSPPDADELKKYLVDENQFDEQRVMTSIKKLIDARKATNQVRMDKFFKPKAAPNADALASKRKAAAADKKSKKPSLGGVSKSKSKGKPRK